MFSRSFQILVWSIRFAYQVIAQRESSVDYMPWMEHNAILHADDIAILCNDVEELAEILNIYDRTFKRFGLKISYGKTETMSFKKL